MAAERDGHTPFRMDLMVQFALSQSISSATMPHFTPISAAAFSMAVPAVFGMWTNVSCVLWCWTRDQRLSMRLLGAASADVDETSIMPLNVRPCAAHDLRIVL